MPESPSKEEISTLLNKFFKTNIDWTKLSRDELVELVTVLDHPEILYEALGISKKDLERGKVIGQVGGVLRDAGVEVITKWEGPFASLARKALLGDDSDKSKESKESK
jgi:hypothetical protein